MPVTDTEKSEWYCGHLRYSLCCSLAGMYHVSQKCCLTPTKLQHSVMIQKTTTTNYTTAKTWNLVCVDCITNDKMKKNFTFNWSSSLFACSNLLLASFNHICNSATNWLHSRSLFSPCWASAFLTYRMGGGGKNKIKYKFLSIIQNMWLQWQVESIMFDTPCYSQTGLIQIKATQFQESKHVLAHK